jgi:hypothetical protein
MRQDNLLALDADLWGELAAARTRFEPFNSPHEGWAVILEEVDELWKLVVANDGRGPLAYREAIQIAAMALRYVLDVCDP